MKLSRSGWRSVKERIELSIQKAKNDEFARPYRMIEPQTGCGFVFVPVTSDLVRSRLADGPGQNASKYDKASQI